MKRFSAQYIFTNTGQPLKRGIVTTSDDGTILEITDTGGILTETRSLEFYNGIIVPGFVNCHCHLELSHLKGSIEEGKGLEEFLGQMRDIRKSDEESVLAAASAADREMYREGIEMCADICNTSLTFGIKKKSPVSYVSLIEIFGINPERAVHRFNEFLTVAEEARELGIPFWLVPHTVYSVSIPLFRLIREKTGENRVTSIHFMESESERIFLENPSSPLADSFRKSGLLSGNTESVKSHADAILNEITPSGSLILVHNTFADRDTVRQVKKRDNLWWCLCPRANHYIENATPPVDLLVQEGCNIVIGTDSLASNNSLSIIEELKSLQMDWPQLRLPELIAWSTINGARALGAGDRLGKIEVGKKPGLILIEEADLAEMKLLPSSFVKRLV